MGPAKDLPDLLGMYSPVASVCNWMYLQGYNSFTAVNVEDESGTEHEKAHLVHDQHLSISLLSG